MRWWSVALVGFAVSAPAQTADEVMAHAVAALGGPAQFAKVKSLRLRGTLDGIAIVVSAARPSSFRMDLAIPDGGMAQAYDGAQGWQKSGTVAPSKLSGLGLHALLDQAENAIGGPLVDAAARGNRVELEGRARAGAKDCFKLKVTLATNTVMHLFIDSRSWLEVREEIGNVEEEVGDYRRFGGILFPCKFAGKSKGDTRVHELLLTNIEINPALRAGIFSMPLQ